MFNYFKYLNVAYLKKLFALATLLSVDLEVDFYFVSSILFINIVILLHDFLNFVQF